MNGNLIACSMIKFLSVNYLKALYLLVCLLVISINVEAQFEQKLTINVSGAYLVPDITSGDQVYGSGIGGDGGIQYNLNTHLSVIANGRFYYVFGTGDHEDAFLEDIAIGGGLKVNFAPRARVNPYMFGEANINFLWYEEWIPYDEPYYDGIQFIYGYQDEGSSISIGGFGGAGLDLKINDNVGIYLQTGAYYTYYGQTVHIYTQVGVRLNLIKSKTI